MLPSLTEEEAGRLGESEGAEDEEHAPDELERDGDAPRGGGREVMRPEVDDVREEKAAGGWQPSASVEMGFGGVSDAGSDVPSRFSARDTYEAIWTW